MKRSQILQQGSRAVFQFVLVIMEIIWLSSSTMIECIVYVFSGYLSILTLFSCFLLFKIVIEVFKDWPLITMSQIPDGSEVIHFQGHPGLVYSMNWSSDDNMLLSASADCTACIWSIRSQDHFPFQACSIFFPLKSTLASDIAKNVSVEHCFISQMLPHPSFVYCAVFLPTDMSLATGCRDHVIRIWKWNDSSGNYEVCLRFSTVYLRPHNYILLF